MVALSANFTPYGDMSDRMASIAAGLGPEQEIYSIDECFIGLAGVRGDLVARGHAVRERILQWIGIPTGIGIGGTKTLAKLANHVAKSADRKPGSYPAEFARVCDLAKLPASDLEAVLAATKAEDFWEIGPHITARRARRPHGPRRRADGSARRAKVLVGRARAHRPRAARPAVHRPRRRSSSQEGDRVTRSFGRPLTELPDLVETVTTFASRAGEKLRRPEHRAGQVLTFIHTSPFRKQDRQYARSITVPLRKPSCDSTALTSTATPRTARDLQDRLQLCQAV